MKINKILGKRGRITIPYELRIKMGFRYNDVVSFEEQENNTIIIRREKICDGCSKTETETVVDELIIDNRLFDFFEGLSVEEQRSALIQLYEKWAHAKDGGKNA